MGLCVSTPKPYLTRDSGGHLVEVTVHKPIRQEKNQLRREAKALQDEMGAHGMKNVKVRATFG